MIKTSGAEMDRMNNKKMMTRVAAIAGAMVFALLAGCATVAPAPTADDIVAERAQARWDALLARDYATAYSYYSPGFRSRVSVVDLEIKIRLQRVRWTGAKYRDHTCTGDTCTVRVDVNYEVSAPVPGVSVWKSVQLIEEQWLRTGGEWWYVPADG
jgi:hypothetical protein